jgi:hypothetical protein
MNKSPKFEEKGYLMLKRLIPRVMCDYLAENIKVLEADGPLSHGDEQVQASFATFAPVVTETLLDVLTPVISSAIGWELFPTYSYLRIYLKGAVLARHIDRPSCEVSATLCISSESPRIWPLCLETVDGITEVKLEPGDGVIYKGMEVPHWREEFEGDRQVQVFLHYVKKNGAYQEFKFDGRPHLTHHPARTQ